MDNKNCVLLVGSCDAYKDILDIFFKLLKKYWPDLPYKIILSTENLEYKSDYFKIKNIHPKNDKCSWTERIADTLDQIEEDYVMLMLDDFFLYDFVNTKKIEKTLKILKKHPKIASFTFWPIYCINQNIKYNEFIERKKGEKNKVAAIASIWNKKKLLKYTKGYKETAWEWEQNATKRSNKILNFDKFYVSKDTQENYIPYDFTKYGLFSGKWIKSTEDLFKKENINIDYNKRGFYDEALRGLEKSITTIFEIDSAIIPNYNLTHKGSSYQKYKGKTSGGVIKQIYKVKGARDIIRWEPAILVGFGLKNLKIEIFYKDKSNEIIDIKSLFGNFLREKDVLLFNNITPHINIPTKKDKLIKKIKLSAILIHPINKTQLVKSYLKETKVNENSDMLERKIYYEILNSKEKMGYIRLKSNIKALHNNKEINIEFYEKYKNNKFKIIIPIKENWNKIIWNPNELYINYTLNNLQFYGLDKKGHKIKLNKEVSTKHIKENNSYHCLSIFTFNIETKKLKEVIIKGKFQCPINTKVLRKYLIN